MARSERAVCSKPSSAARVVLGAALPPALRPRCAGKSREAVSCAQSPALLLSSPLVSFDTAEPHSTPATGCPTPVTGRRLRRCACAAGGAAAPVRSPRLAESRSKAAPPPPGSWCWSRPSPRTAGRPRPAPHPGRASSARCVAAGRQTAGCGARGRRPTAVTVGAAARRPAATAPARCQGRHRAPPAVTGDVRPITSFPTGLAARLRL